MSQYDKDTKFYWLQLKEDFFDDDAIQWIEEQKPNGRDYAYFYLKLCLKSLRTNGVLIRNVGKILIPYDNQKLAELTRMDFDTVTIAMELLKRIGLIEILENGEIYIKQIENLVGSKSKGAFKKQQQRYLKEGGQGVDNCPPKCPPKIEIELELEKEIEADVEVEKEIDAESDSCVDGFSATTENDSCDDGFQTATATTTESDSRDDGFQVVPENDSCDDDFQDVIDFYENNIGMLTPYGLQQLQSYYDDGIEANAIVFAMQKAVDSNIRTMKYIKAILNSWYNQGIKTLIEAKNEQEEYQKAKQHKEESPKNDLMEQIEGIGKNIYANFQEK